MSHERRWAQRRKSVPCSTAPFTLRSLALEWEGAKVSNRDAAASGRGRRERRRYVMHWTTTSVCLGHGHLCWFGGRPAGFSSTSKRQIKVSA